MTKHIRLGLEPKSWMLRVKRLVVGESRKPKFHVGKTWKDGKTERFPRVNPSILHNTLIKTVDLIQNCLFFNYYIIVKTESALPKFEEKH